MLTSLLDCGDELCRQIVSLIRNKDLNVVTHVADIVSTAFYCIVCALILGLGGPLKITSETKARLCE